MRDVDLIFEWKVHPLRDDPKRATVFLLTLSATLAAVWWSFHHLGWVLVAAAFVGGSLHRFWLVTRYRVSDDELEYRRLFIRLTRRWSDFRRVVLEPSGAFLSPFAEPNRLDPYRGIFLPYPPNAGPFKAFLERRIERVVTHV
jgi:hypothetical protein